MFARNVRRLERKERRRKKEEKKVEASFGAKMASDSERDYSSLTTPLAVRCFSVFFPSNFDVHELREWGSAGDQRGEFSFLRCLSDDGGWWMYLSEFYRLPRIDCTHEGGLDASERV